MKEFLRWPAAFSAILFSFNGFSQGTDKWKAYTISQTIDTLNLNSRKIFRDKKKAKSLENNIANFYLYKNGTIVCPPPNTNNDFFSAGCLCFNFQDTLLFSSGLGRSAGVGVGIKIHAGDFSSSLHVNAKNAQVFKFHKSDTSYTADLVLEPESQSLKLTHAPDATHQILVGEYTGTYRYFYERGKKSGKDYFRRYSVHLIFKCKITGIDSFRR
jgi:hypothetical protein